ncbi:MAG: hypothetical protein FVQ83_16010 [Chloroflexi bacterium]|nr:hypothetical protein [Chloroflexota bacterium]
MNKILLPSLCTIFVLTIASCSPQQEVGSTAATTSTPSPSPTTSPTSTLTATAPPMGTFTLTLTPQPTLSEEEIEQKLIQYYETNGNCELPCFWGIIPGETTLQEVENELVPLSEDYFYNLSYMGMDGYYIYIFSEAINPEDCATSFL